MELMKIAIAGTLESSDAQVIVEPHEGGIELELTSSVMHQYGRQIRQLVLETLGRLGVNHARVSVNDKGALECTVEAAVYRSAGQDGSIPWGGAVK